MQSEHSIAETDNKAGERSPKSRDHRLRGECSGEQQGEAMSGHCPLRSVTSKTL